MTGYGLISWGIKAYYHPLTKNTPHGEGIKMGILKAMIWILMFACLIMLMVSYNKGDMQDMILYGFLMLFNHQQYKSEED